MKYFNRQKLNAIAYFVARISGLLIQLCLIPILAKSLGAKGLGELVFAQTINLVLVSIVDFGFNTTATRAVALEKNNNIVRELYWSIQAFRFFLLIALFLVLSLYISIYGWLGDVLIFKISLMATFGGALSAVWYFQGREKSAYYVSISVVIRMALLGLTAVIVQVPSDIYIAALLIFSSELIIGVLLFLKSSSEVGWGRNVVNFKTINEQVRTALHSCSMSVIFSVNAALPVLFLKNITDASIVGVYAAADKIIRTSHSLIWPLAQAYYPHVCDKLKIINIEPRKIAFQYTTTLLFIAFVGCTLLFFSSEWLVLTLYGKEFSGASHIINVMLIFVLLATVNTGINYFYLFPLGKFSFVNRAVVFGSLISAPITYIMIKWHGISGAAFGVVSLEFLILLIVARKSILGK